MDSYKTELFKLLAASGTLFLLNKEYKKDPEQVELFLEYWKTLARSITETAFKEYQENSKKHPYYKYICPDINAIRENMYNEFESVVNTVESAVFSAEENLDFQILIEKLTSYIEPPDFKDYE